MATEAKYDNVLNPCRWCDALLIWADGPGGERIPFDADPDKVHEIGYWALSLTPKGEVTAQMTTRGQAHGMRAAGVRLYAHHGLSCPHREKWHKVAAHGSATRKARSGRR